MSRLFRVQDAAPRSAQVTRTRAYEADPTPVDPVARVAAARQEAAEILAAAKAEASSLIESARTESAILREQAEEDGYSEGRERGYEEGLSQASDLLRQAGETLDQATDAFQTMLTESEPKLLSLALATARRVSSDALRADPEVVLDLIRKGLDALRDERDFSMRVDPKLLSIVEGAREDLGKEFGVRTLEVVGDSAVEGGSLVRTPHGFVDATIKAQIENLASALAEARKRVVGEQQ